MHLKAIAKVVTKWTRYELVGTGWTGLNKVCYFFLFFSPVQMYIQGLTKWRKLIKTPQPFDVISTNLIGWAGMHLYIDNIIKNTWVFVVTLQDWIHNLLPLCDAHI